MGENKDVGIEDERSMREMSTMRRLMWGLSSDGAEHMGFYLRPVEQMQRRKKISVK